MTLNEIRTMLVAVDPDIRHYFSTETAKDYTYWEETGRLPLLAAVQIRRLHCRTH